MSSRNCQIQSHTILLLIIIVFCNISSSSTSIHQHDDLNKTLLCHPDQSLALLQFKSNFVINSSASLRCHELSGRSSYPKTETWKEGTDCCSSWDGVTCHVVTGHVIGLDLSCSQLQLLQGTTMASSISNIFSLPNLKKLNLAFNDFKRSSIPSQLGLFAPTLMILDLTCCNFSGSIPESLGNLTKITHLNLSYNQFSGEVASSIGYLSQLVHLDMEENMLRGQVPNEILSLTHLEFLNLGKNQLEGPLPSSYFHAHPPLFPQLKYLDLCDNLLNGSIPSWLFTLPSVTQIHLQNNNFRSHLDEFVSQSLESLDLSNNRFFGQIPRSVFECENLTILNLRQNSLNGSIGELPWKKIEVIDLHSNFLEGSLPSLPLSINYFSVANNSFTGEIPSQICDATSLKILELACNKLFGLIPSCLGSLSDLLVLNLRINNFHGPIPDSFTIGSNLSCLNLNGNQLSGALPRSLINCKNLEVLDLDDNLIADNFPEWLGTLPRLQVLVLRSNKFYGFIDIGSKMNFFFPVLRILDLSNNNFSGAMPRGLINNLISMMDISEGEAGAEYMGNNEMSYDFSVSVILKGINIELVKIITVFASIDLSKNKFEGKIPKEIGKMRSLRGLNFSNNCLNDSIPSSLGELDKLECLDLSSNKLIGQIPIQLVDLKFLSILNLSHNHLHGPVPLGKQFNTFSEDSYKGNPELCGFPLPKTCGGGILNPPLQPTFLNKDSSNSRVEFNWKGSYIGYGFGMIFGMTVGYFLFSNESSEWFVKMVLGKRQAKVRRSKKNVKVRGRVTRN